MLNEPTVQYSPRSGSLYATGVSLGPPESSTQTASRSLQPFFSTRSVTIGGAHSGEDTRCTVTFISLCTLHSYQKSVPVSHQHQTFCSDMRTQETTHLWTISPHNHREFWRQNFYRHTFSKLDLITVITEWSMWTHGVRTKLMLTTFYDFLIHHFKKRKKSCFWKSAKNVKYIFSNTDTLYRVIASFRI